MTAGTGTGEVGVLPTVRDLAAAGALLEIPGGVPGFPGAERYAVEAVDGSAVLFVLRAEDDTQFVVADPFAFFPGYAPVLPDGATVRLGLESPDEVLVLSVLNVPEGRPQEATANLLAPVVVNLRTLRAEQVLLAQQSWSLRAPLAG